MLCLNIPMFRTIHLIYIKTNNNIQCIIFNKIKPVFIENRIIMYHSIKSIIYLFKNN